MKAVRLGLVFPASKKWLGGRNYYLNLARVVAQASQGIRVVIFCSPKDFEALNNDETLSDVEVHPDKVFDLAYSRVQIVKSVVYGRDNKVKALIESKKIDCLYEGQYFFGWRIDVPIISWIPDFQHKHLAHNFSLTSWIRREFLIRLKLKCRSNFIFSSNDARDDFFNFYSRGKSKSVYVARFAIAGLQLTNSEAEINREYKEILKSKYFIVCNQMWPHKNHLLVLRALRLLIDQHPSVKVVFTGSLRNDWGDKTATEFFNLITHLNLENSVSVLGVVPYEAVLTLVDSSIAVINPSLFEGWNTSVEEAMFVGSELILSDIKVHREQCPNAKFFDPFDAADLFKEMREVYRVSSPRDLGVQWDYPRRQQEFINQLVAAVGSSVE